MASDGPRLPKPVEPRTSAGGAGEDFVSGTSGIVIGPRATGRALAADALSTAAAWSMLLPWRLRRAAARWPRRRVLALSVERVGQPTLLAPARRELERTRHQLSFRSLPVADRGRFENLNRLLEATPASGHDWLLVIDDDVLLPAGFLDAFVFLAERFELRLAQPAHRARSHAAWRVTRRRRGSVVRETGFVEIGPVVGFHATTFGAVLPFPALRIGWGVDLHWSALAREHAWRIGVIDATPIGHGLRPTAASYDRADALAETRRFLADHRYVPAAEANRTLVRHRGWR
jgi:hypothetical protein